MSLKSYFKKETGLGVLSTAAKDGRVDAAVYARPHVISEQEVAFIMADKLSHANLQGNAFAAYLFKQDGPGYQGKRLFLKKTKETTDNAKILAVTRRCPSYGEMDAKKTKYLVFFKVEKVLPLIGDGRV